MPRKRLLGPDGPTVGRPLSDEQHRNLRFRHDLFAPDGRTRVFATEAERAAAWHEHRHRFTGATTLGSRCSAFWAYESGVPDELRRLPPVRLYKSVEIAARDNTRIVKKRDVWLLAHPEHHRTGEREVLERLLAPPPPPRTVEP